MTRFYDAKNDYELDSVSEALESGGIEFTVQADGLVREILVAEEDLPQAEELVYLSTRRMFCTLNQR